MAVVQNRLSITTYEFKLYFGKARRICSWSSWVAGLGGRLGLRNVYVDRPIVMSLKIAVKLVCACKINAAKKLAQVCQKNAAPRQNTLHATK